MLKFIYLINLWLAVVPANQSDQLVEFNRIYKETSSRVTFSAVGDIMCHSTQFNYAFLPPDSFDFDPVFEYVKPILSSTDFTMGNIETVFAGKKRKYSGYPLFNSPDEFMQSLKNSGFDLLFSANNHALDKGKSGLLRTIKLADSLGINISGTYISQRDRDSLRIRTINNISFGILSYTYSLNGFSLPNGEDHLISQIDKDKIRKEINSLKESNVDLVMIYFHFGDEYNIEPSPYQRDIVNFTIAKGADIIIASHPHVLQPVEMFKPVNSKLDSGFVAYSLGNFVSNQRWRYSDCGIILNFEVTKKDTDNSLTLSGLNYIPFWVFKGKIKEKSQYKLIPSEIAHWNDYPDFLSEKDIKLIKESLSDTKKIVESKTSSIKQIRLENYFNLFPISYGL